MVNYQNLLFNKVNNELDPQVYSSFGKVTTNGFDMVTILGALTALLNYLICLWFASLFVFILKRWHKYSEDANAKQFPLLYIARKSTWKAPRKAPRKAPQKSTQKPPCTNDQKEAPPVIYVPPREDKLQLWVKPCTALVIVTPVPFKTRGRL